MKIRQRVALGLIKAAGLEQAFAGQKLFSDYWDPSMSTAPASDTASLLSQYGTSGWVYIGAKRIALTASSADLQLVDANGNEIAQHVLYDTLDHPNQGMSGRKLRHLLHLHLELVGEAFWYVVPNGAGGTGQIIPLPPQLMEVIPGKDRWVEGYLFDSPGGTKVPFKPEEIVHFAYPNPDPANPMRGTTGLRTLTYQIATNQNAQIWNYQFFVNGARPSGYLSTDLDLPGEEAERLRRMWDRHHKGQKNWNKTAVATHGLKYLDVGLNQTEMDFLNQLKNSRDFILNVMGVPKSIAGVIEDVNRANSFQDEVNFMTYTINPILEMIADTINAQLMPMFGDTGVKCDFETLMPKDDEFTLKKVDTLIRRNVMMINEARSEYGLDPVPWGDKPWGTSRDGVLQTDSPVNISKPSPSNTPTGPGQPPQNQPDNLPGESPSGENHDRPPSSPEDNLVGQSLSSPAGSALVLPGLPATKAKATSRQAEDLAYAARLDSRARRMSPQIRQVWGDVERSVVGQITKTMNGDGQLEVDEVVDNGDGTLLVKTKTTTKRADVSWKAVEQKLRYILLQYDKEAAVAEGLYAKQHYRLTGDVDEKELAAWAAARAVQMAKGFVTRAEDEISAVLSGAANLGLTYDEIVDNLKIAFEGMKTWSTNRVALTEVAASSTKGRVDLFGRSKDVRGLQWSTAGDERVRISHQDAEAQVVPVGGMFMLGSGVATPGPGLSGNPEEDCNCRCCVYPVLTSETGV